MLARQILIRQRAHKVDALCVGTRLQVMGIGVGNGNGVASHVQTLLRHEQVVVGTTAGGVFHWDKKWLNYTLSLQYP